jgi:hypothetical protein
MVDLARFPKRQKCKDWCAASLIILGHRVKKSRKKQMVDLARFPKSQECKDWCAASLIIIGH